MASAQSPRLALLLTCSLYGCTAAVEAPNDSQTAQTSNGSGGTPGLPNGASPSAQGNPSESEASPVPGSTGGAGATDQGNEVPMRDGSGGTSSGTDQSDTGGSGSGGSGGTSTPLPCDEAEEQICSSYQVGDHCSLTFEIWTDSESACMKNTALGFDAIWDEGDGNYLARKGVRPGSPEPIVKYTAEYSPNGNSYLGVYGWTTDPLIEYYIIDSWGSWRPPGTDVIGTVEADGGTYEIYRSERVNQPSIQGNTTFWQYWSVRTEKRTSGTITVKPHFEAWANFGLTLGDFYEVSMLVEGYHSSGSASVEVTFE